MISETRGGAFGSSDVKTASSYGEMSDCYGFHSDATIVLVRGSTVYGEAAPFLIYRREGPRAAGT